MAAPGANRAFEHAVFLHAFELLGSGVGFFDTAGRPLHANGALIELLEGASGRRLRQEMELLVTKLCARSRLAAAVPAEPEVEVTERQLAPEADAPRIRLRGGILGPGLLGVGPLLVVCVEPMTQRGFSDEELRERFALSRQETRIARLLAAGRPNAEIAGQLSISPHTARHHTERVLSKLAVRSRAEVAGRLAGAEPPGAAAGPAVTRPADFPAAPPARSP